MSVFKYHAFIYFLRPPPWRTEHYSCLPYACTPYLCTPCLFIPWEPVYGMYFICMYAVCTYAVSMHVIRKHIHHKHVHRTHVHRLTWNAVIAENFNKVTDFCLLIMNSYSVVVKPVAVWSLYHEFNPEVLLFNPCLGHVLQHFWYIISQFKIK
jgi:hypothetical protein